MPAAGGFFQGNTSNATGDFTASCDFATPTASPDDRSTEFRPAPTNEIQSGETLLVEAYAVIWLIVFGLVWFSWRRLRLIDDRIAALESSVARARRAGTKDAGTARKEPR